MTGTVDLSETIPVREAHRFPTDRLEAHLRHEGVIGRLLDIRQMRGGQSNPTFKLTAGGQSYVLRTKPGPAAKLLASGFFIY